MSTLDGLGVMVLNRLRKLFAWAVLICGVDASGNITPVAISNGGGVVPASWVRHSVGLGASASQAIPDGAFYQYTILTGTGSDGTMTGLPAGYSDSSPVPVTTGFTISTDSASSAAVVWFTAS